MHARVLYVCVYVCMCGCVCTYMCAYPESWWRWVQFTLWWFFLAHVGAQFMLKQLHKQISAMSYDSNSIGPSMQMHTRFRGFLPQMLLHLSNCWSSAASTDHEKKKNYKPGSFLVTSHFPCMNISLRLMARFSCLLLAGHGWEEPISTTGLAYHECSQSLPYFQLYIS